MMNGPRLGLFESLQKLYGATDPTCYTFPIRNIAAAATSGILGAAIGSPFFLVKARIQAASSAANINSQYAYTGMVSKGRLFVFQIVSVTMSCDETTTTCFLYSWMVSAPFCGQKDFSVSTAASLVPCLASQ